MAARRRDLLRAGATALVAGGWGRSGDSALPGEHMGANAALGHRLRTGDFPEPEDTSRQDIVIVGGGIAGLSAGWRLAQRNVGFSLLELELAVGGNAASGRNAVSAYPWGAHYVPRLTRESVHAAELFQELGVIEGWGAGGDPIYNPFYLCADPRERLFAFGRWQDDLLPVLGSSKEDRRQYESFLAAMDAFRARRGTDGRKAFAIPMEFSADDDSLRALDALTMTDWMRAQGWTSEGLHWYVDYCCRDDYGSHAADVSAWAGIHYFASRDGVAAGDNTQAVLTWPEGNGWIVHRLEQRLSGHLTCGVLVWRVRTESDGVAVDLFDPATGRSRRVLARAAILAVPHFVADRLLGRETDTAHTYAPWMVANITLDRTPDGVGMPLCWDNVIRDSRSVGYVVATHQSVNRVQRGTVLTWYWPLCDHSPNEARRIALATPLGTWQAMARDELLRVHPELKDAIARIDVWLWGHGMIRPVPGYIWGAARAASCRQSPPLFRAHSDMSGLSLFEEANHRGVTAADAATAWLGA